MKRISRVVLFLLLWCPGESAAEPGDVGGGSGDVGGGSVSIQVLCPSVPAREIRRVLEIELDHRLLPPGQPDSGSVYRIAISCTKEEVRLRVHETSSGRSTGRVIHNQTLPPQGRGRLIALAAAELVARLPIEANEGGRKGQRPPRQSSVRQQTSAPRSTASALTLSALATGGGIGSPLTPKVGGGLALNHDVFPNLGWGLDVIAEHASSGVSLGTARQVFISSAITALARFQFAALSWRIGAGGRLGAVHFRGAAQEPREVLEESFWAFWAGPVLITDLSHAFLGRGVLKLSAETGHVTLPVSGLVNDEAEVSVEGPWFSLSLGIGLAI